MRLANMKSVAMLSLLVLSCSYAQATPQSSAAAASPDKQNATVSGTVLRLDTGEPLKKARVGLQNHGNAETSFFELTDDQGHFVFDNVPPGPYDLQVSRNGFVDAQYGQKKPGAPGAILTLNPGQRVTDLVFKLWRAAAISGHVYDEDGQPIAKAEVIVYRASHRAGKEQRASNGQISTNDLGEYRVFDLAPGRYYLAVNYRIFDYRGLASREAQERFNPGYLPIYYPNTSDPGKAEPISVGPGDDVRAIDFLMRPGHLATVSGKVINTVDPTAGAAVRLEPRNAGLGDATPQLYDFTKKDRTFSIHNVPPGSYNAETAWQDPQARDWQRVFRPLDVGSDDIENVVLTISRGIDIAGHVTWDGSPPRDSHPMIHLQPPNERGFVVFPQSVKTDGTFQFKNVPEGNYRLVLLGSDSARPFYLKSVRYGSASVTDTAFAVDPGSDASFDVVLSTRVAQLSGSVLNSDSLPAVGAKVVIIPDPPHRDLTYRYLSATTDQNGKFSINGIAPGDYKVFSWDSIEESDERYGEDWFDPTWLKPYEAKGQSIHFEESDQKSVALQSLTASDTP
ncbi:MAG TPA: carboxypeptidase-like regulatory domain-containing protein [Candidatus Sulfotelmatobacter sp.]|nr:carboxypeptidase-like regulatory domain-containing protein [Candidatus Sulfotelmatobacter sp.]